VLGRAVVGHHAEALTCYELYQLRNTYVTNFGTLYQSGSPRYIQSSLKFSF